MTVTAKSIKFAVEFGASLDEGCDGFMEVLHKRDDGLEVLVRAKRGTELHGLVTEYILSEEGERRDQLLADALDRTGAVLSVAAATLEKSDVKGSEDQ